MILFICRINIYNLCVLWLICYLQNNLKAQCTFWRSLLVIYLYKFEYDESKRNESKYDKFKCD